MVYPVNVRERKKLTTSLKRYVHIEDNGGRLRSVGGRYGIELQIGMQSFRLENRPNTRKEAEWYRKMLVIALANLITDRCR